MDIEKEIRKLFKEYKKIKYVSLTYVDEYASLSQSFIINKEEFIKSKGNVLRYWLSVINSNLTRLYNITTYKENHQPVKSNYYDKYCNIIEKYYYKKESK